MAFNGNAVFSMVSESLVRVTGLSLLAGASGTIGLAPSATIMVPPDVVLPAPFKPAPYNPNLGTGVVELQDAVNVQYNDVVSSPIKAPVVIVKTGTTASDFLITLTNDAPGEVETATFELYIRFK